MRRPGAVWTAPGLATSRTLYFPVLWPANTVIEKRSGFVCRLRLTLRTSANFLATVPQGFDTLDLKEAKALLDELGYLPVSERLP